MKKMSIAIISVLIVTGCFAFGIQFYKDSLTPNQATDETETRRVALVTDPLEGNNQFIMQAYNELLAVGTEFQLTTKHLEASDTYTWTEGTRELCEEGFDLIIGLGWQATTSFTNLTHEYPDTQFAVVDANGDGNNVRGVTYEVTEGCYTMGAMLATAFPEEEVFGYIGNFPDSGNFLYESGFRQGVLSVNPEATFSIIFAETYSDASMVRTAAETLQSQGISVIMGSVSSSANEGLYDLCLEHANSESPLYATGLSVDQTTPDNPYIIAGVTKDTALPVRILVEEYVSGTYSNTDMILGLSDGGFGVVHLNETEAHFVNQEIITQKVISVGQDTLDGLTDGTILYQQEDFN